jgi:hypothetical protein
MCIRAYQELLLTLVHMESSPDLTVMSGRGCVLCIRANQELLTLVNIESSPDSTVRYGVCLVYPGLPGAPPHPRPHGVQSRLNCQVGGVSCVSRPTRSSSSPSSTWSPVQTQLSGWGCVLCIRAYQELLLTLVNIESSPDSTVR